MDGVPFITQPPVKPGETFTYEFIARNPGSHMYHSHLNSAFQVTKGLLGAFIIEPKDKSAYPAFDKEYTMILDDGPLGYTLNGHGFPATEVLTANKGEKLLVRFMNEGLMIHPMHLHGMPMTIVGAGRLREHAVPLRHGERGAGAADRRDRGLHGGGGVGVPLPHPRRTPRARWACSAWSPP